MVNLVRPVDLMAIEDITVFEADEEILVFGKSTVCLQVEDEIPVEIDSPPVALLSILLVVRNDFFPAFDPVLGWKLVCHTLASSVAHCCGWQ
ncbi:hypothetical protein [Haladaptatus sp. NG-SE-30]